jgi:hypothetical protein
MDVTQINPLTIFLAALVCAFVFDGFIDLVLYVTKMDE